MKKINFTRDVLPHLIAFATFLVITLMFFNPLFFGNKVIHQEDIIMWEGSSKAVQDYREETGEEGLWAPGMFSGMPAYLVNVEWSNAPVFIAKKIFAAGLPHPVGNIFIAFASYYILLLSFRVRPYLAIAGAVAFGLCSYLIIGLSAGHNARIGAVAFMPLVIAGIHLVFSGKRWLGFGVTALGMALHLRENHLQITYYMMIVVAVYGLVMLVEYTRTGQLKSFFVAVGLLIPAVLIAAGTFFGQFWAITEYGKYSMRGPSELASPQSEGSSGLTKEYAFAYSSGIWEPFTLLIPNYYGGSGTGFFVQDDQSETYQALVNAGNETANQLASFSRAYWGPQTNTPYYAGAIVCFLFVLGIVYAEKKYVWWLVPVSVLGIALSWGDSFRAFNYFMFDYFPGYNKFRSVTFAMIIPLFAMPLLGMLGLERLFAEGWKKDTTKKLAWPVGFTLGICLVHAVIGGPGNYFSGSDAQLPAWFLNALREDRKDVFMGDVWRSFWFVTVFVAALFAHLKRWIPFPLFCVMATILIALDLSFVDRRHLGENNFQSRRQQVALVANAADQEILKDPSYFRVYNLQDPFGEARTSFFHSSIGGYHGAKLRRYQDLYDSCVAPETQEMIRSFQAGNFDFNEYGVMNMLNVKYFVYGTEQNNIIRNTAANGNAWFVKDLLEVNSPAEELHATCSIATKNSAVVDISKFTAPEFSYDSSATIELTSHNPGELTFTSSSGVPSLAVFSEVFYPVGWTATIDDEPASLLRVNYILRALPVPAGNHTIKMSFEPKAYRVGNKVTMVSSWLLVLVAMGAVVMSYRKENN